MPIGRRKGPAPSCPDAMEIMAAMPNAVLLVDPDQIVADANGAAEALFNQGRTALIGRRTGELLRAPDGAPLIAADMSEETPVAAYDIDLQRQDHRILRIDLMASPMPDRPGWLLICLHNRSAPYLSGPGTRRRNNSRTAVGAAGMLAHEIKNPLSGIRGAAQLIQTDADESVAGMTRLICKEVDRITALIDRMEGFTDTREFTPKPVNIHAVLGHTIKLAQHGFGARVEFREIYDPSLPDVLGDHDMLVQIFLNLVKNAVEALENTPSPCITLTTAYRTGLTVAERRNGRHQRRSLPIEVCVIDNGPGVSEDIADHLFEPFVSTRTDRPGGLGLALVDKLVRDLGGMIEYVRDADRKHTVFRMLLPRVETRAGKTA